MLKKFADTFWDHIRPRSFYSWQSAFGLSLLAWILSLVTQRPDTVTNWVSVHSILSNLGWILLIVAMGWFTTTNPVKVLGVSLGPWLTGILVCLYLFVRSGEQNLTVFRVALMTWPLISMAIAAFPEFITVDEGFRVPRKTQVRQWLVVLLLANLLLTCWIFLGVRILDWTKDYPGVRGETFARSAIVMRPSNNFITGLPLIRLGLPFSDAGLISFIPRPVVSAMDYSRGVEILSEMVQEVRAKAEGETLSNIERWLFDIQKAPATFRDAVMLRLTRQDEGKTLDQRYWQVELGIGEPEYKLTLGSRWDGPRDRADILVVGPTGESQSLDRWLRYSSNPKGYVHEVVQGNTKTQECRSIADDRRRGKLTHGPGYVVQQICQISIGDNKRGIVNCDPKSLKVLRQPQLLQPCDLPRR
jgi:hypothetical protein